LTGRFDLDVTGDNQEALVDRVALTRYPLAGSYTSYYD
jgi:hypothetical protein